MNRSVKDVVEAESRGSRRRLYGMDANHGVVRKVSPSSLKATA